MSPRTEETNQRIRDEQRKHILDAARKVFARKGLIATRMTDIANEAGVSYGLTYHYFKNKEEIFATLVENALRGSTKLIQHAMTMPGTPWDRIVYLGSVMLAGLKEDPEYSMVVLQAFTNEAVPQEVRKMAIEQSIAFQDAFKQLIIEGQAAGQVVAGNPDYLTSAFNACINGLAVGLTYFGSAYPSFPDLETILHILEP